MGLLSGKFMAQYLFPGAFTMHGRLLIEADALIGRDSGNDHGRNQEEEVGDCHGSQVKKQEMEHVQVDGNCIEVVGAGIQGY